MNFEKLSHRDKVFGFFNFLPIEKCRIHLYSEQGEVLSSAFIFGKKESVSDIEFIQNTMMQLKYKAMKKMLKIKSFEIVHNHKTHTLNATTKRIGELSQADQYIAKTLKKSFNLPIKMSIFTDQGFKLTKFF